MILHESWVRNKLRYWSILHLSIYIIASVAMIAAIEEYSDEYYNNAPHLAYPDAKAHAEKALQMLGPEILNNGSSKLCLNYSKAQMIAEFDAV